VKFADFLGAVFGQTVNSQISAAETDALAVAQAVAVWGAIVVVELGIVIYLLARKK
jgi:hypothetical protein